MGTRRKSRTLQGLASELERAGAPRARTARRIDRGVPFAGAYPVFYRYSYLTSADEPVYFAPVRVLSDDISTKDGLLLRFSAKALPSSRARAWYSIHTFAEGEFAAPKRWAYVGDVSPKLDAQLLALGGHEDAQVERVSRLVPEARQDAEVREALAQVEGYGPEDTWPIIIPSYGRLQAQEIDLNAWAFMVGAGRFAIQYDWSKGRFYLRIQWDRRLQPVFEPDYGYPDLDEALRWLWAVQYLAQQDRYGDDPPWDHPDARAHLRDDKERRGARRGRG